MRSGSSAEVVEEDWFLFLSAISIISIENELHSQKQ